MPEQLLNNRLINATFMLLMVILIGWLLFIGRDILIPIVIAVVIWYVIDTVAQTFQSFSIKGYQMPRVLSVILSLGAATFLIIMVFDLIASNAAALAKDAPVYQQRIEVKLNHLMAMVAPGIHIDMNRYSDLINLEKLATWVIGAVSSFMGVASLVLIYIIFLVSEQRVLDNKFAALFPDGEQRARAEHIRLRIADNIRSYLTIKTLVSLLTGVLSYIVLSLFDVNYPAFWGFIIFLLNYIPTIGSMIGVIFPALLTLVQFDSYLPFLGVTIVLTAVQFTIGNILEPYLMGNRLNLSGLVIIISLAVWGAIWGITGMILSVPLMVILLIILAALPSTRPIAILLSSNGAIEAPTTEKLA